MNDIKILLYTQDATPIEYDVSYIDEIPISFNFLISDIRNPDKKNASFSKTITFPGTKDINKFFELIWKSNISLNYFNPNKKCDIYYYVNSVLQFKGDLQLIKINVDDSSGEVVYECSCKGTIGNVFTKIGDKLLSNPEDTSFTNCLNFSTYNHNLTFSNVTNSWATSIQVAGSPVSFALGNGYVYPLINYGNQVMPSSGNTLPVADRDFEIKYFRPAIYKKTILDKIFSDAGYSYTSNFFNSTFYKSQIIPTSGDKFEKTAQQLIDNQFYVGRSSDFTVGPYNAAYVPASTSWNQFTPTTNTILFNATTSPYNNAAGKYNSANGKFTTTYAAYKYVNYNIEAVINLDLDVLYTGSGSPTYVSFLGNNRKIFYNIKVNNQVVAYEEFIFNPWVAFDPNAFYPLSIGNIERKISLPAFALYGAYDVKVDIGWNLEFAFYDNSYNYVGASSAQVRARVKSTKTFFSGNYVNTNIDEDDAVDLNKVLPINIKQIDWLMSEFKLHNLYMVQDKDNEYNYFIEDRENFYSGSIDWSDKRDYSMKREVLPIGELDFLKYELEYKEDADYLNDKYQKDYKESFGKHIEYVDNDFITQTKDVSVIYSGTPLKGNYINGLVIPTIYKVESGAISPIQSNIRSLYYGGLIAMNYGSWNLWRSNGNTVTTYSNYPFAGDCDNPYNPTLTLNWDTPHEVYYTYPQATYTNNNLYNRFYSRMINQLTDKNSKIEKRYYNLTAYDIKNFDFRNVVWDDGYYIVNAIKDYNFMKPQSTMVELLKLTDYAVFIPDNDIDFNGGDAGGDGMVLSQMQNLSSASGSNINFGYNSNIVGGDNNFVASGANSVTLTNSNNVVIESSVSNFTGVNLTANSTITSGGINLSDAITIDNSSGSYLAKVNASQIVSKSITITADYTINGSCNFFYVNATDGNIKITIDGALFIDYEFTFFRTDSSANSVKLYGVASETLNGAALPQTIITGQYSTITIKSNATNIFII